MSYMDEITVRRCGTDRFTQGDHWSAYYTAAPAVRGNGHTAVIALAALLDKVSDPEWLECQRAIVIPVIPQTDAMTR